jgi:hypothetical protein
LGQLNEQITKEDFDLVGRPQKVTITESVSNSELEYLNKETYNQLVFNENGFVLSSKSFEYKDTMITTFNYNDNNQIALKTLYTIHLYPARVDSLVYTEFDSIREWHVNSWNGGYVLYQRFTYNDQNKLNLKERFERGELFERTYFQRNAAVLKKCTELHYRDSVLTSCSVDSLDSNGNCIESNWYKNDIHYRTYFYKYDTAGRFIHQTYKEVAPQGLKANISSTLQPIEIILVYDAFGRLTKRTVISDDTQFRTTFIAYTSDGKIESERSFFHEIGDAEMEETCKTSYTYDKKTRKTVRILSTTNYSKTKTKYSYDNQGNWVRIVEKGRFKKAGRSVKRINREIEYFK